MYNLTLKGQGQNLTSGQVRARSLGDPSRSNYTSFDGYIAGYGYIRRLHSDSTYITHGCMALKSIFIGNRLSRDTETEGKYRPIETREPQKLTESNLS